MKKQSLLIVFSILFSIGVMADSLWEKSESNSIFDNKRIFNIGDIITVKISAESTAVQEAGTTTRKSTDIGANFFDTYDQYSLDSDGNNSMRKIFRCRTNNS